MDVTDVSVWFSFGLGTVAGKLDVKWQIRLSRNICARIWRAVASIKKGEI